MDSLFAVPTPESETTADVTPLDVSVVLPIYNERGTDAVDLGAPGPAYVARSTRRRTPKR